MYCTILALRSICFYIIIFMYCSILALRSICFYIVSAVIKKEFSSFFGLNHILDFESVWLNQMI